MSKLLLLVAAAGGAYYIWSSKQPKNENVKKEFAFQNNQVIDLTPATDGSGRYELPASIVKRGGPTTTTYDRIVLPPPRFEIPIVRDEPVRPPIFY